MKANHILILIILSSVTLNFLGGCRKSEPDCEGTENLRIDIPLSKTLRDKVPHSGSDTLIFFNQQGDTVYLRGTGSKDYTFKDRKKVTNGDGCPGYIDYSIGFSEIQYEQDPILSKTKTRFPFNSIILNADSTEKYFDVTWRSGGVSILTEQAEYTALYALFDDQYYNVPITINNRLYMCAAFGFHYREANTSPGALYFNHHQGIVQFVENDTTIWSRIIR